MNATWLFHHPSNLSDIESDNHNLKDAAHFATKSLFISILQICSCIKCRDGILIALVTLFNKHVNLWKISVDSMLLSGIALSAAWPISKSLC